MQFTSIAFSVLCSALLVSASEVNPDDIPQECTWVQECQSVTQKAASCGGTAQWGDVFSQPDWISCACNQIGVQEIQTCVDCAGWYNPGGDIVKLDQACKDRKY
ncbi:hypothetical protein CB0940_10317 [Cercospora beticola]|uniref:Extracellular membrane protein CFEM domain-containing protein n=1 Tax=Cercospora beticola TaxID=122368 RepID=A0A2G5HUI3_CERBT|nr:hypothetical protein CB0940_10317 [Cercospora beticola]PIA95943.1 hypothetical protein CB0940_10317 [Cercospora beticola]WPB07027.1 hypothetical protein RHO25_011687 [Cercospora beticola]CAK1366968.1 unnamed protein product [Cercospora beticola]